MARSVEAGRHGGVWGGEGGAQCVHRCPEASTRVGVCRGPQRAVPRAVGLRQMCSGLRRNEGEVRMAEKRGVGGKSREQGDLLGQPWGTRVQLWAEAPESWWGQRGPERPRSGRG